ncbi:carbohydrate ABC transporter permease [Paenibacillus thalictri]|uniref:Sugar ABC transporter permease n=1 Tax=Paenibacillus thalictri TaxID=2527873 RepID=A0A4Q9DRE9_9BACL|nr:sugar ABC transporter permease [Paenibacillus thalictri]TBL79354.1 sugar ABC transporter permease [Paenibacillus thalictri]
MNPKKEAAAGVMFLLPSLLGYIVFMFFPIVFSLILSFSEWDLISGLQTIKMVGLENFKQLFQDDLFFHSLKNNFIYAVGVVPVTMIIALLLAVALNRMVYMKGALRLVFFMPYITTIVAASVVWMALLHPSQGPLTQFLHSLGVEHTPQWLGSTTWALPSLMLMMIWNGLGYDLVIYMAGLQGISKELHEAAEVDGATGINKFFYITIPLLSPTTFFLFITRIIQSFEVFGPVNIMTQGGPGDSTSVLVHYIYVVSFQFYKFGYGSAIAWVLFLIIFLITLIQWRQQKKWVTYT